MCQSKHTHEETAGFHLKHTELPRDNVQSHVSPDLTKHFHKGKAPRFVLTFPNTGDLIPAAFIPSQEAGKQRSL